MRKSGGAGRARLQIWGRSELMFRDTLTACPSPTSDGYRSNQLSGSVVQLEPGGRSNNASSEASGAWKIANHSLRSA